MAMATTNAGHSVHRVETAAMKVQRHEFSGPIPPPELLARYNEIVPDAAERILAMAEREAAHRQMVERDVTASNIESQSKVIAINELRSKQAYKSDRTGQLLGAVVSVVALGGAVFLAMNDREAVAAVIAALPVASLIRAFTLRHETEKKPEDKKSSGR